MLRTFYPLYFANRPLDTCGRLAVADKFSGRDVSAVATADSALIDRAIAAAVAAEAPLRRLAPDERRAVLDHCARRFEDRASELAEVLCVEAGKPIKDSRGEVARLIDTFRIAADKSTRLGGEVMNLELSPRTRCPCGMFRRARGRLFLYLTVQFGTNWNWVE